jgi:uncharacterized protein (DUF302 family)
MKKVLGLLLFSMLLMADSGLITLKSEFSVDQTVKRFKEVLQKHGMTVFTTIDHTAGAKKVGKVLRPTQVVIFGNPKAGTPLMQCVQTVAIDLPQKALIFKDGMGHVWLTYNDPAYLAQRHGITGCEQPLKKVSNALRKFTWMAVSQKEF